MNFEAMNVWTTTFYAIVHALSYTKNRNFPNLDDLHIHARQTTLWITPECSYASTLLAHPGGRNKIAFRRDPNKHFEEIAKQLVSMLTQDLVVIFDQLMADSIAEHKATCGGLPQTRVQKLQKYLDHRYLWSAHGCYELIAVRNVLTHNCGRWNQKTIDIIKPFVNPLPNVGDSLTVGVPMLFYYRKAIRTFLNETRTA